MTHWKQFQKMESNKNRRTFYCLYVVIIVLSGCNIMALSTCNTSACNETAEILLDAMNFTADPCQNFYEYACGNYDSDDPQISSNTFSEMDEVIDERVKGLLESDEHTDRLEVFQVRNFYQHCMKDGDNTQYLKFMLEELGGWPIVKGDEVHGKHFNLVGTLTVLQIIGFSTLFSVSVSSDDKENTKNIISINGDDNLDAKDFTAADIDSYTMLIMNVATALGAKGTTDVFKEAREIYDFKAAVSNLYSPIEDDDDPYDDYLKISVDDLQDFTDPEKHVIDWLMFLRNILPNADLTKDEMINVPRLPFIRHLINIFAITDQRILANYILWDVVYTMADDTGGPVRDFVNNYLHDKTQERWRYCIETNLNFAVGRMYVDKYYSEESRNLTSELAISIQQTLVDSIMNSSFMDNTTKTEAVKKAKDMKRMIGYPDWIMNDDELRDYYEDLKMAFISCLRDTLDKPLFNTDGSHLVVRITSLMTRLSPDFVGGRFSVEYQGYRNMIEEEMMIQFTDMEDNHFINSLNVLKALRAKELKSLREPVDIYRDNDNMIIDANAQNVLNFNIMVISSGLSSLPIFHVSRPAYCNFGSMGSILGHEMSHGFDEAGRYYDSVGDLKEWWTKTSFKNFKHITECFKKQYSKMCPTLDENLNKLCVNGNFSVNENIADNNGLELSFWAWKKWTIVNGEEPSLPGMEDFTPEQIFFLSFARTFCAKYTLSSLREVLKTDPHSPGMERIIGSIQNSQEFSNAFQCAGRSPNSGSEQCSLFKN